MSRPFKPADCPQLSPYLVVPNPKETITFLEKAFQFQVKGQPFEQGGQILHAELTLGEARVAISPEGSCPLQAPKTSGASCPIGLYIYVEDVDTFTQNAINQGAKLLKEPEDQFWGDRMAQLEDINGYQWTFATNVEDFDPSKIPANF